jgi:transitional endoplasmic reticulum ATPase
MVKKEEIKLKVSEAMQDDAYKGIARIDPEIMKKLGLRRGDIITIKGQRETVAIVDRAYPSDMENIIRIDGILRRNSRVGIGDMVSIGQASVKEAKKITIAPAQKGIMVQADSEGLRRSLLGRAVTKGDLIVMGGVQRRKDLMSEDFGDMGDIFGNLNDLLGGMGFGNLGGNFSQIRFSVVNTNPNAPVIITENTEVVLNSKAVDISEEKVPDITYEDIGGLKEEIRKIREMVEIPMKKPEIFERLGITPPRGVLLHGPPGTGKTLLAKAVANESDAHFILLNGPEIMSKFYGESEKKIREIFDDAEKNAPSIIFIDEIDAIAPKREDVGGEVERRVVSQLLTMMDGLKSRGRVIVVGATNRVNAVDPALRRPGRFDREIEVGVPSKEGRLAILKIHSRGMPIVPLIKKEYISKEILEIKFEIEDLKNKKNDSKDKINKKNLDVKKLKEIENSFKETNIVDIKDIGKFKGDVRDKIKIICMKHMLSELAGITHGFVGADLESLTKEAAMNVLRKHLHKIKLDDEEIPKEVLEKLIVKHEDFLDALKVVRPSAMREVLVETPNIGWEDIGGLEEVKQDLKEAVEWPIKYPESFTRMGIRPSRGILLYGPPGTGKTLLAKAVAKEAEANFIQVKGPSLLSMWVGKSEEGVRKIFERARQVSPCIIFFDEIDSLAGKRGIEHGQKVTERVLNQLLAEMDGLEDLNEVLVVAATNRPDMLDPAILRPGRFDKILLVNAPSEKGRVNILKIHTNKMPIGDKDKEFEKEAKENFIESLSKKTDGYSGADLEAVVREAAMLALREDIESKIVTKKHFDKALDRFKPSITKSTIDTYRKIEDNFLKSARAAVGNNGSSYLG